MQSDKLKLVARVLQYWILTWFVVVVVVVVVGVGCLVTRCEAWGARQRQDFTLDSHF